MADQKLSALPVATTPSGTELIYLVQGGVSKQSTVSAIASTPTLQQVLTAGSTLAGNNTATGIGDLTLGTDDPGVYTSTIKTSGSTILQTSDNGVDTGLFTQTPTSNTFTKSVTALSFIKSGGTSSQFLKADGTVDSTVYGIGDALTTNPLSQFAATTSAQLAGVISDETGSGALVFGTSPTFTTNITTPQITGVSGVNGLRTITNNTASGAIARGLYHTPTLVAAANGDQLTSLDIAPTFTNGAFTSVNNLALTMAMGTATVKIGNITGTTNAVGIYLNQVTPSSTNYAIRSDSVGNIFLNCPSGFGTFIATGANSQMSFNGTKISLTPTLATTGAVIHLEYTVPSSNSQTATTNIPIFKITGNNKQWATGTVANQYWNYLTANTASFVGASTITNSYGLFVEAATAGTNATITNNYAAGFGGNILITGGSNRIYFTGGTNYFIESDGTLRLKAAFEIFFDVGVFGAVIRTTNTLWQNRDGLNFQYGTTTGSKIGTATTQKLSFWNATPIVQPTTAVAAATVVSGTGGNVKHDDTFDGYTLQQIVKALRNTGLLA